MRIMDLPSATQRALEVGDFVGAGYALAVGGSFGDALKVARQRSMSSRTIAMLEKATIDFTLLPSAPQQIAFVGSLANSSAFDRMASDNSFRLAPLETPIVAVTAGLVAGERQPGEWIVLSKLTLADGGALERRSTAVIVALTNELLRAAGPAAEALFSRELRSAIAKKTDEVFLTELLADAPAQTAPDFAGAVSKALGGLVTSATSQVYLILAANVALAASGQSGAAGLMYPTLGPAGGSVGLLPAVVSDAMPADTVATIDADQVIANTGEVEMSASRNADLKMVDDPATGPGTMVSLYQTNSTGLRATRQFGFSLVAPTGVAQCTIAGGP